MNLFARYDILCYTQLVYFLGRRHLEHCENSGQFGDLFSDILKIEIDFLIARYRHCSHLSTWLEVVLGLFDKPRLLGIPINHLLTLNAPSPEE